MTMIHKSPEALMTQYIANVANAIEHTDATFALLEKKKLYYAVFVHYFIWKTLLIKINSWLSESRLIWKFVLFIEK